MTMNDQFLQGAWQKMKAPLQIENILSTTISEIDALKKTVRRRNRREIAAAIFLVLFFLPIGFLASNMYSKIGAFINVLAAIIIIVLLRNKKDKTVADITLPPVPYLYQHLSYLKKEVKLLSTVIYWYILPLAIGMALFFFGLDHTTGKLLLHYGMLLFISVVVYIINKMAVDSILRPLVAKLETLLKEEEQISANG